MAQRRPRPPRRPKWFQKDGGGRGMSAEAGQPEAGPPLQDAGRAALAEVMRRYDEKRQAQRAEAEAHARALLSEREQVGAPLLPEATEGRVQP